MEQEKKEPLSGQAARGADDAAKAHQALRHAAPARTSTGATSSRHFYITCLSVLSMCAVVCLHTNGVFWRFASQRYWFTANIIESLFYFAVPVFFMISGATLLDYQDRYSTKEFFLRRAKKTVIPFLAWSLIGFLIQVLRGEAVFSIKALINGTMGTSIVGIYWFFPLLFSIYLSIPLFAAVDKAKRRSVFTYLAVGGMLVNALIPLLLRLLSADTPWPLTLQPVVGCYIYICIGYLLSHYQPSKQWTTAIYVCAVVGLLIHIVGTGVLSVAAGAVDMTFKGYDNVPCILYATGVFLFVKDHAKGTSPLARLIAALSGYTFGVYLIHSFLVGVVLSKIFAPLGFSDVSIVYRLGAPILVIPLCVLIIYLLRKLPFLKAIVP